MKHLQVALSVCLLSGVAMAQNHSHLQGSDTLKRYTENLLTAIGLEGPLHYDGGGSGLGIAAIIRARTDNPSQRVAPASRLLNATDLANAAANRLQIIDHVLALDGVVIHVNDVGNAGLTRMKFSDAQRIWRCQVSTWDQVPGSSRTDAIFVNARDEVSGTTDNFQSRITGFNTSPPDSWWNNYPCVTVCRPGPDDHCTEFIGSVTASIPNAIGYTGLPGLQSGNRDLALCNDTNPVGTCNDPDYVFQNITTIRNGSYPLSRQLHYYSITSTDPTDPIDPATPQSDWLTAATTPGTSCPLLQAQGFISDGILCNY